MKLLLTILTVLAVALPAVAVDIGNRAPDKPVTNHTAPPADPDVLRQGGDTIAEAVDIPVPTIGMTGTTAGYIDDYDEVCPYTGSASPDVVYQFVPEQNMEVDIDMFGSDYDTKIYVYGPDLSLLACNDDYYPDYTSKIENLFVAGGSQHWLVVDGYGGDSGEYLLDLVEHVPCVIDCPPGSWTEDEPPLQNDYVDTWNGGCNTDPTNPPFQYLDTGIFCGVSGWYMDDGSNLRDTDWFRLTIPATGIQEIHGIAEERCFMFELGPQDCGNVGVVQTVELDVCAEATMTITGAPGSVVWFWVGPQTFASPDGSDVYEFDYVLDLPHPPLAVEERTLSGVKSLFR